MTPSSAVGSCNPTPTNPSVATALAAIRDVVQQAGQPLLASEVLQRAQVTVSGLGQATVYRNLKAMVDEGELRLVLLPGENPRYELAETAHHHHFQCRACNRVFDVPDCPGNLRAFVPRGFVVEDHDLTLYDHCSECSSTRATRTARQSSR